MLSLRSMRKNPKKTGDSTALYSASRNSVAIERQRRALLQDEFNRRHFWGGSWDKNRSREISLLGDSEEIAKLNA